MGIDDRKLMTIVPPHHRHSQTCRRQYCRGCAVTAVAMHAATVSLRSKQSRGVWHRSPAHDPARQHICLKMSHDAGGSVSFKATTSRRPVTLQNIDGAEISKPEWSYAARLKAESLKEPRR